MHGNSCVFLPLVCQMRSSVLPFPPLLLPPSHWRQHAGRNKSPDDMKEGGFCPVRSYPSPPTIQNPENKQIHRPVLRFPTKTDTPAASSLRYPANVRPPCLCLALALPRLWCALVSPCRGRPRLRKKKREERAGNVTYSAGRRRRRRREEEGGNGPLLDNPVGWSDFLMEIHNSLSKHS